MERVVVIIQARMGSQRFPGKMIAELNGRPLIEWVLRRCRASRTADAVVLAAPNLPEDDVLATVADQLDVSVFRGSSSDVLARYALSAEQHNADIVVRICADRPLVAPEVIDQAVSVFREQRPDLVFNHIACPGANWPRGFGAEVVSMQTLAWLHEHTTELPHREHVTLYLWDHEQDYQIVAAPCPPELDPGYAGVALDVDLPDHLAKLKEICAGQDILAPAETLFAAWRQSRFAGQVDVG